jgi:hypothetical protein
MIVTRPANASGVRTGFGRESACCDLARLVFSANRFYQRPAEFSVPVLQLSYNDKAGRFP